METSKKILALDSSGLVASVAVVEGNSTYSNLLAEYTVNYKKTHSQTLLPMLDEIANMTELDLTTIWDGPTDLSDHGCQKKSGVYRYL